MTDVHLSDGERRALCYLVESWNAFVALPCEHPDDQNEFRDAIHRAQMMILARPERRSLAREENNQPILAFMAEQRKGEEP